MLKEEEAELLEEGAFFSVGAVVDACYDVRESGH